MQSYQQHTDTYIPSSSRSASTYTMRRDSPSIHTDSQDHFHPHRDSYDVLIQGIGAHRKTTTMRFSVFGMEEGGSRCPFSPFRPPRRRLVQPAVARACGDMCQYPEWELNVDLREFEEMIRKDFVGPGACPTYIPPSTTKSIPPLTANPQVAALSSPSLSPSHGQRHSKPPFAAGLPSPPS